MQVRPDVIPKLMPILSAAGKSYFEKNRLPLPRCSNLIDGSNSGDGDESECVAVCVFSFSVCFFSGSESLNSSPTSLVFQVLSL